MAQHSRPLPSPRMPGLAFPATASPEPDTARADDRSPHPSRDATLEQPGVTLIPRETADVYATDTADPAPDARAQAAESSKPPELPWYRTESWLAVMLAAFVPFGVALVAPVPMRVPLLAVGGLLIVTGLALLVRHEA